MIQWVYADERSLSILERSFFSLLHLVCRPYNRNILGRAFCVSSKLRKGYPSSKLTNYSAILCSFCSVLPSFSCFQMFQDQLGLLLLGIFQKIGFSLSPREKKIFQKENNVAYIIARFYLRIRNMFCRRGRDCFPKFDCCGQTVKKSILCTKQFVDGPLV